MSYPELLEKWWVEFALKQLGADSLFDCSTRLEKSIQALSDFYTKQRIFQDDLFQDRELLSAYGLFFFPQTFARTSFVFREILHRGWKPSGPVSILDVGSGAGAASFAIASEMRVPVMIHALDQSANALSVFQTLARDVLHLNHEVHRGDIHNLTKSDSRKYDVIVASYSLSETQIPYQNWTSILEKLLKDDGIVMVLEPSLKETAEKLEVWRNDLAAKTPLYIWGPCLHQKECPLLSEGKYWCHEVRSWRPPDSLSFVNRHLHREIHITRFSFLAFGKTPPQPLSEFAFRLISPVSRQKKDLLFSGCANDGRKHTFRFSTRSHSESRDVVRKWERGDILTSDEKGVQILESCDTFVVQNKFSPHHEVGNE